MLPAKILLVPEFLRLCIFTYLPCTALWQYTGEIGSPDLLTGGVLSPLYSLTWSALLTLTDIMPHHRVRKHVVLSAFCLLTHPGKQILLSSWPDAETEALSDRVRWGRPTALVSTWHSWIMLKFYDTLEAMDMLESVKDFVLHLINFCSPVG